MNYDIKLKSEVFFGGFENKEYPQAIFEGCKKSNIKVTLFTSHKFNSKFFDELLDINVFFDPEFRAKTYLESKNIKCRIIDSATLLEFTEAQIYYHRLWDRVSLSKSTFRMRERHFIEVLTAIFSILYEKRFNLTAIWREAPHSPACIIVFFVCKFLNIPFYFAMKTSIDGSIRLVDDFRPGKMQTVTLGISSPKNRSPAIFSDIENYLDNHFLKYGKAINEERVKLSASRLKRFKRFLRASQRILFWVLNPEFQQRNSFYRLSSLQILLKSIELNMKSRSYQNLLARLSVDEIPNAPFVFYPLNFQPEMTTDPTSGFYTHPHLIVREILEATPEHVRILVKEHPRQFLSYENLPEINFRDEAFLRLLKDDRRVTLIDKSVPNERIFPKACLVVGSTGSALWEANIYGVPSLSFAHTWHNECLSSPSIYQISSTLRETIENLFSKTREDVHADVKNFLNNHGDIFIQTVHMHRAAVDSIIPFDTLVDGYVTCVKSLVSGECNLNPSSGIKSTELMP